MQKIISTIIVWTIVLSHAPITFANSQLKVAEKSTATEEIPALDWATVDWDLEVSRMSAENEYMEQLDFLEKNGKLEEIQDLKIRKAKLSDDKVMQEMKVPGSTQALVREYREEKDRVKKSKKLKQLPGKLKQFQQNKINSKQNQKDTVKKSELGENQIDIRDQKTEPFKIKNIKRIQKELDKKNLEVQIKDLRIESKKSKKFKKDKQDKKTNKSKKNKKISWLRDIFFPKVYATEIASLLQTDYVGIEDNLVEYALLHLSNQQNLDGSFGGELNFAISFATFEILHKLEITENQQYLDLVNFLQNFTSSNQQELAQKLIVLTKSQADNSAELTELLAFQNSDGGVGLQSGYLSDVETTLSFITALNLADPTKTTELGSALNFVLQEISTDGSMRRDTDANPDYLLIAKTLETLQPFDGILVGSTEIADIIQSQLDFLATQIADSGELLYSESIQNELAVLRVFRDYNYHQDFQEILLKNLKSTQNVDGSFATELATTLQAIDSLRQPDLEIKSLQVTTSLTNGVDPVLDIQIENLSYQPVKDFNLNLFIDGLLEAENLNFSISGGLSRDELLNISLQLDNGDRLIGNTQFTIFTEAELELNQVDNWQDTAVIYSESGTGDPVLPRYFIAYPKNTADGHIGFNIRWNESADPNRANYIVQYRAVGETTWRYVNVDKSWNGAFIYDSLDQEFIDGTNYEVSMGVVDSLGSGSVFTNPITLTLANDLTPYSTTFSGEVVGIDEFNETLDLTGPDLNLDTDLNGSFSVAEFPAGKNILSVDHPAYQALQTKFNLESGIALEDLRLYTRLFEDTTAPTINDFEIRFVDPLAVKNQRTVNLWGSAEDDHTAHEADFYYYNPATEIWHFLGSDKFSSENAFFDWDIPAELFGTGYQVKAVVWDYQDNFTEQTWGPFEVIDGSEPNGTVAVNFTDSTWPIGESYLINWDLETTNQLDYVSLSLYLDETSSISIANEINTNQGFTYTMPIHSYYVSDQAFVRMIACDTSFNCGTIDSTPFSIVDNTKPPMEPWSEPLAFDMVLSDTGLSRDIKHISRNSDGSWNLFYTEYVGYSWLSQGEDRRFMYRKMQSDGTWLSPIEIAESWHRDGQTYPMYYNNFDFEQIGDSEFYFTYGRHISSTSNDDQLYFGHIQSGTTLTKNELIIDGGVWPKSPKVVSDANEIHFFWREGLDYDTLIGESKLYQKTFANDVWSTTNQITNSSTSDYNLAFDTGDLVLSYRLNNQIRIQKYLNSVWSTPIVIRNPRITKSLFADYAEDANKLDLIVENDPSDPDYYLWLSNVTDRDSLEAILSTNNFVYQTEISNLWYYNEYLVNASKADFQISLDGSAYNFFTLKGSPETNWQRDLNQVTIEFDVNDNIISQSQQILVQHEADAQVDGFAVTQGLSNDVYHLAYSKENPGSNLETTYYGLLKNDELNYQSYVSSVSMDAGGTPMIWLEAGHKPQIAFWGSLAGNMTIFTNSADFTSTANYVISDASTFIKDSAPLHPEVSWDFAGTESITSYDVYLGNSKFDLDLVSTGLANAIYQFTQLEKNVDYFWRIIATTESDKKLYSPTWQFHTTTITHPPTFDFSYPVGQQYANIDEVVIRWTDEDTDSNAKISLYYSTSELQTNPILIAEVFEDETSDAYTWNTKSLSEGDYYVFATVEDLDNPALEIPHSGFITKQLPTCGQKVDGSWNISDSCLQRDEDFVVDQPSSFLQSAFVRIKEGFEAYINRNSSLQIDSESQLRIERGN